MGFSNPASVQVTVQGQGMPVVVASKADRDALAKYVGLTVLRQDLSGRQQIWDGNGWRYWTWGTASAVTDANGFITTPHNGDGQTPLVWFLTITPQQTNALNWVFKPIAWAQDATNITIRAVRTDTSNYLPNNAIAVNWWAQF